MRTLLAWQEPEIIDRWIKDWQPTKYTRHTIVNKAKARAKVEETRKRGYSISDEEFTEGLLVISVPIFDRDSNVAFILNCTSLKDSIAGRESMIGNEMLSAAAVIQAKSGGRSPLEFARILAATAAPR
jgi:DNA-binding IclR family transcriptional regulator